MRFMYAAINIHQVRIWRVLHEQPSLDGPSEETAATVTTTTVTTTTTTTVVTPDHDGDPPGAEPLAA